MCGIAGIVRVAETAAPVERAELRAMAAALVHRGPDDAGEYLDAAGRCGLAFRRLAIIDLATGNQPLGNENGRLQVVFNGEIYNFRELREELRRVGHVFATQGDAEVIVHAYEQWGEACFARFNGMFAAALWDEERGELILARDRFGKKPLVYAQFAGRFYFASEAKAILALPGVPRELDAQALHEYLVFQYVPAPHAIFRGLAKLRPGWRAVVRAAQDVAAAPYCPPPASGAPDDTQAASAAGPSRFSFDSAAQAFDGLMKSAVERRLVADVPLGAFLSGGIDSSIVVGLMRRLGVSPLRTFSIRFEDARYDESAHARRVAEHFQTEHHEYTVTPDARAVLDTLAQHFDEPFADSSAIPTWYVAQATRRSVTVALTGDGGDEAFGGYDRYRALELAARLDWLPAAARRGLARLGHRIPHGRAKSGSNRLHRFLTAVGRSGAQRYLDWVNVFPPETLAEGYAPDWSARLDLAGPAAWFERLFESGSAAGSPAGRAALADLQSYLPYDVLTKVDIASMACGLECRCPFLDPAVVEFGLRLPPAWRRGKQFLREWARPLLPAGILKRPKMGFGVPIGEWFRRELRGLLEERVLGPQALSGRVFRPEWLRGLVEAHVQGRANHEHRLWALLMLELWAERWLGNGRGAL